jgi:predicted dehydrogenase
VGTSGYGARHLENIRVLEEAGLAVLTAAVDPFAAHDALGPRVPVFDSIDALRAAGLRPDILVVATPISTHAELAASALRLGADVLLEKPPVADLAQFHRLLDAQEHTSARVQVGFQSLGSHALPAIDDILRSGEIGRLRAVGIPVVDGVATNPLAHAVVTALAIAGARALDDVVHVSPELYRANDIESDDTSVIRVQTASGIPVTCGLTLCAREQQDPTIIVDGTEGRIVLEYTRDRITIETPTGTTSSPTSSRRVRRNQHCCLLSRTRERSCGCSRRCALRTIPAPSTVASSSGSPMAQLAVPSSPASRRRSSGL